jgi:dihydroxy-acid dehydratase
VENGDIIIIDAEKNVISLEIPNDILNKRKQYWKQPEYKFKNGILYKYARTVSSASEGCVTDEFNK